MPDDSGNANYPAAGRWRFTIDRLVAGERGGVTDGVRVDRAISFFELRDGRICHLTEYWPEDGDAPAWRSPWVEREGTE